MTNFLQVADNADTRAVADSLNNLTTPLVLTGIDTTKFPAVTTGYALTIWDDVTYPDDPDDDPNMEKVLVTAATIGASGSFTITRQNPKTHAGAPRVALLILSQHIKELNQAINATEAIIEGLEPMSGVEVGPTPPTNTTKLWIDTDDAEGLYYQQVDSSFAERPTEGTRSYLDRREVAVGLSFGDGFNGSTKDLEKIFVLSEVKDQAGILTNVWHAAAATNNEAYERDINIRIFIDDSVNPVCDVPLSGFYGYGHHADKFNNQQHGRLIKDNTAHTSGAYRYLFAPFQKYMRVEFVYKDTNPNAVNYWTQVSWTSLDQPYYGQKRRWSLKGQLLLNQNPYAVVNGLSIYGRGQIEYMNIGWQLYGESIPFYAYEGNAKIVVDNEVRPAWMTTGGEDLPNGAFGLTPVGGYPGGMPGVSDLANTQGFYRWFDKDPVYFNTRVQASYSLGQRGQPIGPPTGTGDVWQYVSYWTDSYSTPNYLSIGSTPLGSDSFSYSAGALPSPWRNNPGGNKVQATGSGTAVTTSAADADRGSTRSAAEFLSGATNYWVEVEARINSFNGTDPAEAMLTAKKLYDDGAVAEAVALEIKRTSQYDWSIVAREDFGTIAAVKIDGGEDLIGVYIKLAIRVNGSKVTLYWKFADDPNPMQAFAAWATRRTGTNVGIGTFFAGAEFRNFKAYPLVSVTL